MRPVLLESKGLHVMLHLMAHSLVKGLEGRSVLSPTAHVERDKVTTQEACSFVSRWICPKLRHLIVSISLIKYVNYPWEVPIFVLSM